jgi:TRAP-type C4-dicarboxylate transport system permease small subunit
MPPPRGVFLSGERQTSYALRCKPTTFYKKNVKSAFLSFERRLTSLSLGLACLMMVIAACMGMLQVLMRFVFELPSEWSEVIVRISLIWMVFLGIPAAFRFGSMISVDLMHRLSPPKFQRFLEGVIAILSLILLAIIAWYGWDYAQRGSVQTIIGLEYFSMFWAFLALPVGAVCAMIGVIGNFLDPRHEELATAQ